MAGELAGLCGEPNERIPDRKFTSHGYQRGVMVTPDGAKTSIARPGARNIQTNSEAVLATYEALNNKAFLDERALALVSAGLPERQFGKVLEKSLEKVGVSPSAISRRMVRSTQQALEDFEQRRWDKHRFVALLFDGVRVGRTMVVACVGVDLAGRKSVLAVHPGATENARVCRDPIRKLTERGLDADGNYLFIVDGSKALGSAIEDQFGKEVVSKGTERSHDYARNSQNTTLHYNPRNPQLQTDTSKAMHTSSG